jgi:hypothetical protein
MLLTVGNKNPFEEVNASEDMLKTVNKNGGSGVKRADTERLFEWRDYWLVPLYAPQAGGGVVPRTGSFGIFRSKP